MSFASPTLLLWASLAIPIVVFYVLKVRLRRVPISTLRFWQQVYEEKQARSIWRRFRHLVSLVVQLVLLLLLIFALAEPYFHWESLEARRLVLVIDNSASMNATDNGVTRLARARAEAHRLVGGIRFRDEVSLIVAGMQPRVMCGFTGHQRTLRDMLDAIPTTDGPTRVPEAVALARRLLADAEHGEIVVLSDGGFDDVEKLAAAGDVRFIPIGSRAGNIGITRLQARRSLQSPIGYEVLVEVINASDEPVECRLDLDLSGDPVDRVPLKLAANGEWRQVFEGTSIEGGRLIARIDAVDALPTDNEAVALLPRCRTEAVVLVTDEGGLADRFLTKVLQANPLIELSIAKQLPEPVRPGAITIFHRRVPAILPPGPTLVIDPAGDCDFWKLGEKLLDPTVGKQERDSPLLAHVRLTNLQLPDARALQMQSDARAQVLAQGLNGETLCAAIDRPQGRVLVLTGNLAKGTLPLRTAFPILMVNALAWCADRREEMQEALPTGAAAEVKLSRDVRDSLFLRSPDGKEESLSATGDKCIVGPLDRCGVWSIVKQPSSVAGESQAATLVEIPCNLMNRRESDLRVPALGSDSKETVSNPRLGQPLWFYLVVLAWLLAGVEWFLYQRRWIS